MRTRPLGWSDLVCPKCGGAPVDVSPDYFIRRRVDFFFDLAPAAEAIMWTCPQKHKHITGFRDMPSGPEFSSMECGSSIGKGE